MQFNIVPISLSTVNFININIYIFFSDYVSKLSREEGKAREGEKKQFDCLIFKKRVYYK